MMNSKKRLEELSDKLTMAHHRIQQNFQNLNPVIGVRQSLRDSGFPADLITIDCLSSRKRIILLLHDQQTETVGLQYSSIESEANNDFTRIENALISEDQLYEWMLNYLAPQ